MSSSLKSLKLTSPYFSETETRRDILSIVDAAYPKIKLNAAIRLDTYSNSLQALQGMNNHRSNFPIWAGISADKDRNAAFLFLNE